MSHTQNEVFMAQNTDITHEKMEFALIEYTYLRVSVFPEIALIPGLSVFILPMLITFSLLRIAKNAVFLIFLRNIRPVLYGLKAKIFSLLAMMFAFAPLFYLLYDIEVALESHLL